MDWKETVMNGNDWEDINQKAGIDVMDIAVNLDNRYTVGQQADLIVERCNLVAKAQAEITGDIAYAEGIKEGVRRAYENMVAQHYIVSYNLDRAVDFLEKRYGTS